LNPSKIKGTRFEREVADYLAEVLPGVDRKALHGNAVQGDISNFPDWALECKATKAIDLGGAIDEARVEAKNSKTRWFAAIVKRRRKGVSEAYVVMTLEQYRRLMPLTFPTTELIRQQIIGGG
jgi:hypothetical protein